MSEDEICLEKSKMLDRFKMVTYAGNIWFCDINTKFDWLRDIESI